MLKSDFKGLLHLECQDALQSVYHNTDTVHSGYEPSGARFTKSGAGLLKMNTKTENFINSQSEVNELGIEKTAEKEYQPDEFTVMKEPYSTTPVHVRLNTTTPGSQSAASIGLKPALKGLEVNTQSIFEKKKTIE
jgi:hypothetical protein